MLAPRSQSQDIPELQTQRQELKKKLILIKQKSNTFSTQINQNQNTIYTLQSLLTNSNSQLQKTSEHLENQLAEIKKEYLRLRTTLQKTSMALHDTNCTSPYSIKRTLSTNKRLRSHNSNKYKKNLHPLP